jgi:hypothetical protein
VLLIMANRLVSIMNLLKGSETDYHVSAKSLRSITFPNLQRWQIHIPPPKKKKNGGSCLLLVKLSSRFLWRVLAC